MWKSNSIGTASPQLACRLHLLSRCIFLCCSVAQSHPTLWPRGLQHARLSCPSLSLGVCSTHVLWCHPAISYSLALFSCCPQSLPASGAFPMSRLFATGGQSTGASASVLPMNISFRKCLGQISFRMDWLDLLAVQGTLKSFPTPPFKSINSSALSFLL